jgi:hypothetical protein
MEPGDILNLTLKVLKISNEMNDLNINMYIMELLDF